jgi:hypothetical protein
MYNIALYSSAFPVAGDFIPCCKRLSVVKMCTRKQTQYADSTLESSLRRIAVYQTGVVGAALRLPVASRYSSEKRQKAEVEKYAWTGGVVRFSNEMHVREVKSDEERW